MTNEPPDEETAPAGRRTLVNRLRIARVFLARMSSGSFLPLYSSRRLARVLWLMTVRTRAIDLRTVELHESNEIKVSFLPSSPAWRCAFPPPAPLIWFWCSDPIHHQPSRGPTQTPAPAALSDGSSSSSNNTPRPDRSRDSLSYGRRCVRVGGE
jgi:hypothetical protein